LVVEATAEEREAFAPAEAAASAVAEAEAVEVPEAAIAAAIVQILVKRRESILQYDNNKNKHNLAAIAAGLGGAISS
jgi:predicted ferric reductase